MTCIIKHKTKMTNYKHLTLTLGVVATANAIRITSLAEAEVEAENEHPAREPGRAKNGKIDSWELKHS